MEQNVQGVFGENQRGRIAVLIEDHFDQTEFEAFNEYFPRHGYQVVYMTRLWGNKSLFFRGNPDDGVIRATVTVESTSRTSIPPTTSASSASAPTPWTASATRRRLAKASRTARQRSN